MKNIHVLPTEKPSRLMIDTIENKLYLQPILHEKTINVLTQNIYITSDKEIKDEILRWIIDNREGMNGFIHQVSVILDSKICPEIILTTDQDLILDGVQAIDDEFLEWFVKNPSCESVKVNNLCYGALGRFADAGYKIIIPKEESKQNIIDNWLEKNGDPEIDKQVEQEAKDLCEQETLEEAKQEGYICPHTKLQCDDECCVSASDCHIKTTIGIISEPKQETLEEVAEKYAKDFGCKINYDIYYSFIAGVKWQQEQGNKMYSEEEVDLLHKSITMHLDDSEAERMINQIFKQFKKSDCQHQFIRTGDSFDLTIYCKKCGTNYKNK